MVRSLRLRHSKPTPIASIFRSFYNINTKICTIPNVLRIPKEIFQPTKRERELRVQVNFSTIHNIPNADRLAQPHFGGADNINFYRFIYFCCRFAPFAQEKQIIISPWTNYIRPIFAYKCLSAKVHIARTLEMIRCICMGYRAIEHCVRDTFTTFKHMPNRHSAIVKL